MTKALLVSVKDYTYLEEFSNILAGKNDLYQLRKSLISGLRLQHNNITLLGEEGTVFKDIFESVLDSVSANCSENDTFILYFSGHGLHEKVAFSDQLVSTNEIINKVQNIKVKSKVIILDCCYSGDFVL